MSDVTIRIDPYPSEEALAEMWRSAWGDPWTGNLDTILERSLAHLGAYDGDRLVGYINVAWDGGVHAFLLDTTVHAEWQRHGIGSRLVTRATEVAKERGAHWLHVDYEERLTGFYQSCGFRPTAAGLIDLKG